MNYLIIDDEPQARKLLQAYMQGIPHFNLIKACGNAMEAYEALHTQKIDLIFLDVKMPVISGIDFLRSLRNPPMVIFTTAYQKFALEGFELNVTDYLLKPIALPRLMQALEKVQLRQNERTAPEKRADHIFVKQENKLVKVELDDILLAEGLQNYVKLHLKDQVLIVPITMKAMQDLLPVQQFIRAHRSYIVAKSTIRAINGNLIETSYQHIPIGSSYRADLQAYVSGS